MELKWKNKEDMGFYECVVTDEDGYEERISIWDYTCERLKELNAMNEEYRRNHPYAFEVRYCNGYSMDKAFDETHTLDDVKKWCEDYLLNIYINRYEKTVANLLKYKKQAEWAIKYKNER